MEKRLVPVNAVIGLATADGINPSALAAKGFHVAGLEIPVLTSAGNVVVDVVLANRSGRLIAFEAKSGSNIVEEQASRYRALSAGNLVRASSVTLPERVELKLEVAYAALSENGDRICQGLQQADLPFPAIIVHPDKITLGRTDHASDVLRQALDPPVLLSAPVGRFIPFDHESGLAEIGPYVKAALVAELSQRNQIVSLVTLTERATPHYALYGTRTQNRLQRRVADTVKTIADAEPDTFELHPTTGNHSGYVKLLRTPEDNDPRGRTQAYQKLARSGRSRLRRQQPSIAGQTQLSFLDELEEADIVEGTEQSPEAVEDEEAGGV